MTTTLQRYREAYASMVVAVYEPLILQWVSGTTIKHIAYEAATRGSAKKTQAKTVRRAVTAAAAAGIERDAPTTNGAPHFGSPVLLGGGLALDGRLVQNAGIAELPFAERVGDQVFPFGALRVEADEPGLTIVDDAQGRTPTAGPGVIFGADLLDRGQSLDLQELLPQLELKLGDALSKLSTVPPSEAKKIMLEINREYFGSRDHDVLFTPVPEVLHEILSPIGIAHFYRQLYFNLDEGVGPIEEAFTIAPLETLEVVYETVRRQVQEEVMETGVQETSESELESHNLEEVSDKVSSMLQRDLSAGIQTKASYSTPVFQVGVSASLELASSNKRSTEETAKRLKETTKRASERITKTFSLQTRTVDEFTSTTTTRRTIENKAEHPVSFGLRRVMRRVRVKVQDLGPRLVWQSYVRDPGAGLALSRFVSYAAAQQISVPDVPPGLPPKPAGGKDSGTAICSVNLVTTVVTNEQSPEPGQYGDGTIVLRIPAGKDRLVTSVSVDSIADVGDPYPDRDRGEPAPKSYGEPTLKSDGSYEVKITIRSGDSWTVNVGYTYTYDASSDAMAAWESLRLQAVNDLKTVANKDAFTKAFDQMKATITERSRIQPRPAADLRLEEREELMGRLVAWVFAETNGPAKPTPLEIETVHRLFELDGVFAYLHPTWWRPRYTRTGSISRPGEYEVTADSEPAPLGSSLGWKLQLDGDARRNAFLNSPWARVCVPIRPGRERQALQWLADHVEDESGFSLAQGSPLGAMVADVEALRTKEGALGINGPDYIEVGPGTGGQGPLHPEDIYPVIDTFEVTVPTEGFVYDEILIDGA